MSGIPAKNIALGLVGLGAAAAVGYHNNAFLPAGYKPWFCWNPSSGWGFSAGGDGGAGDGAAGEQSAVDMVKQAMCPVPAAPKKPDA